MILSSWWQHRDSEKPSNVGDCDVENISDDTACWCLCCVKSVIWFIWDFEIVKHDKKKKMSSH